MTRQEHWELASFCFIQHHFSRSLFFLFFSQLLSVIIPSCYRLSLIVGSVLRRICGLCR